MDICAALIAQRSSKRKDNVICMASMTRAEAREAVFCLLFETEFHKNETPEEIYALALENRDLPAEDKQADYIREVYLGVCEKKAELDEAVARFSNGWRPDRIAPVSRNILRLAVYEMRYVADVPATVALNEAIELAKKFDEEKARGFINGILHSVKTDLEANE